MQRRRALVVGLAGLVTACAGPAPPATPSPRPPGEVASSAGEGAPTPTTSPPTATPYPRPLPVIEATSTTPPSATSTPLPDVAVDLRLWNGEAELQLDGRTIQPGRQNVRPGQHQAAVLVDGQPIAIKDVPVEGGRVDLFVPPPHASIAVMVENQADARPQTGLDHADVVYEALAEGGITRFIAVYLTDDAPVVGPVRSLRHYFAFLAADYGADVVHIGASPEGFAWRDAMNMGHLDEAAGDPGVWRVRTRPPPHNAYTDTATDRALLAGMGRQRNRQWGPLRFAPPPAASANVANGSGSDGANSSTGTDAAERIDLRFRPWPYRVAWQWDAQSGRYLRFMEGAAHRDAATGGQLGVASVIVQFAGVEPIPNDEKLRLDVNLVGASGELVVFSGGTKRTGSWSKDAPRSASLWLDAEGQPLVIPPGPVWVEVMPVGSPLSVG